MRKEKKKHVSLIPWKTNGVNLTKKIKPMQSLKYAHWFELGTKNHINNHVYGLVFSMVYCKVEKVDLNGLKT